MPLYFISLGLDKADAAGIDSLAFFLSLAGVFSTSILLSRLSYRSLVVFSFIISGIFASLVSIHFSFMVKLVSLLLCFLGMAISATLLPLSAIFLLSGARFGAEYGRYRRVGSMGFLAGLIVSGICADLSSPWVYPILTGAGFILAGIAFSRLEFPKESGIMTLATSLKSLESKIDKKFKFSLQFFVDKIRGNYVLLMFGISQLIIWSAFSVCFRYLPLRMSEMGSSSILISITLAILGVVAIFSIGLIGQITDSINIRFLWPLVPVFLSIRVILLGIPDSNFYWFMPMQLLHVPTWVLNDILVLRFLRDKGNELGALRISILSQLGMISGLSLGSFLMSKAIPQFGLQGSFLYVGLLPMLFVPIFLMSWSSGTIRIKVET